MAEVVEKEIWKNVSRGVTLVNVYDHNGQQVQRMVRSGKTIEVTPKERMYLNTDRAMVEGTDVFTSGAMVPESLPEDTPDKEEIEANPNQVSEEGLADLLELKWQKFDAALEQITNAQVLERLHDEAEADEGTTVRQLDAIKARLLNVSPSHVFDD